MMSLFNSFDMMLFFFSSSVFFLFPVLLLNFSFMKSSYLVFIEKGFSILSEFFYSLKPKEFNKVSNLISLGLIFVIFVMNFFSVFSFNFPLTSQFGMIMFLSLMLWSSLILFNMFSNLKGLISHMIPEGTPIYLTVFLFLIELISNIIRPVTLTVRLVANILAGHLLMILLSNLVLFYFSIFPFYVMLNMIEIFVSLIQSYIFTTMIVLYLSEVH